MMKRIQFINSNWLKVLACLFMLCDHLGLYLVVYGFVTLANPLYQFLRIVGRIAYPLFIFLILEGCKHTKNIYKYMLRLGIFAVGIGICIDVIIFVMFGGKNTLGLRNIFVTLLMIVLVYLSLFKAKKISERFFILIPILVFTYTLFDQYGKLPLPSNVVTIIRGFTPDYGLYTPIFLVTYCLFTGIAQPLFHKIDGTSEHNLWIQKIITCLAVIVTGVVYYLLADLPKMVGVEMMKLEIYSLFACIFILLYNGTLGKKSKVIKYGFYCFYPVHIAVIFIILEIILMFKK